ncbi:MAG: hypothetical protein RI601_01525, partial [Desulfurivibrionaceae bacterium]|nr:hypothetical protein [Desulfurivibrionaceae bacterium]
GNYWPFHQSASLPLLFILTASIFFCLWMGLSSPIASHLDFRHAPCFVILAKGLFLQGGATDDHERGNQDFDPEPSLFQA